MHTLVGCHYHRASSVLTTDFQIQEGGSQYFQIQNIRTVLTNYLDPISQRMYCILDVKSNSL